MARTGDCQNRTQSRQAVLNDSHITVPREEWFGLPTRRMRIHKQRYERSHGKDIEKQPIKPISIPQSALKKIRNRYGYQGAMDNAVGNP
jgi:hypothetical protein